MTIALGNFTLDSTIPIPFTTNDGNGGAIGPANDFEVADFVIYKESLADKKASTNGLTITTNGDTVTGLHCLTIDTSIDTGDAGFWEAGANYFVVATPDETVDSQTVVGLIATFTLDPDPFDEGEGNEIIVWKDYGFVDEDGIVRIPIATSNSNGLATPDAISVSIYKEDDAAEKTTANGVTVTTDFDSETGHHLIKIDTNNDTGDAGFWITDKTYHVKIKTTVASAVSGSDKVNLAGVVFRIGCQKSDVQRLIGSMITETTAGRLAGNFSTFVDNGDADTTNVLDDVGGDNGPTVLQSTTIATLASQLSFTLTAGSADDDAYNGCMMIIEDQTTAVQKARVQISDYVGSTKTITLQTAPEFTIATGDTVKIIATPKQIDGLVDPSIQYVPLVTLSYTGTAGTTLHMRIDVVDGYGRIVDVNALDAAATASMTVSEHSQDGGSDMFTKAFSAGDQARKGFEQTQSNPGFTDDRQYIAQTTVTINGTPYVNTETVVNFG